MTNQLSFGNEEAETLLAAGWRQGSVIVPNANLPDIKQGNFFVVCSQSCVVVSPDIKRDPYVELIEASPIRKYAANNGMASGKAVRKFHLPVAGANFEALEVNVNSRCHVDRRILMSIEVSKINVSDHGKREFAGWLARYYSRIALPNELVTRLKNTVYPKLEDFFKETEETTSIERHKSIPSMWIQYEPDIEIVNDDAYIVILKLICDDNVDYQLFDRKLTDIFGAQSVNVDGIQFSFEITPLSVVFLSEIQGWNRFSEWDELSGMWETATIPGS